MKVLNAEDVLQSHYVVLDTSAWFVPFLTYAKNVKVALSMNTISWKWKRPKKNLRKKKIATLEDSKDFGNMVIMVADIMDSLVIMDSQALTDSQVLMDSLGSLDLTGSIDRNLITQEDFLMVKKAE